MNPFGNLVRDLVIFAVVLTAIGIGAGYLMGRFL
jgi:hypothetical protein